MGKKLVLLLLVGVLVLGLAGCGGQQAAEEPGQDQDAKEEPAASNEPIKIGIQGPITGKWAIEGTGFVNGATILAQQINDEGGLLGRQVEIVEGDDKGEPKEAALVAQKMISSGVVAVVGAYNSTNTDPISDMYNEAGLLHITPSSTATHLTEKGYTHFFRTAFLDNRQGLFAAEFMVNDLDKKKIAIIHDNTTYAKGLAEWTQKYIEEKGGEVVFIDAIKPGELDFNPTLTKVKDTNPEALWFTGYFSEGGLLLSQARDMGMMVPFVAGNANNNPDFFKIAGKSAIMEGGGTFIISEPGPSDLDNPEANKFVSDYESKYGEIPPSVWTLSAADAFRLIVSAIEETESTDADTLAEYLRNVKDFPGITGPINYDEKGDRKGTIHKAYKFDENGSLVNWNA
ncbi:branched-chain amino acid ABC transporter substrate-binding protein [Metallumcola ferriviriculae]|uniref:Branched-chain amino acid ABC transporter substrate-binding protein n=1 Tax=Metallumcola ferriviriculae TaxID=3039180 RepID=A0AAU0UMF5_9FIRM|nr:branched-chain amino acid ABC transporter substrate-binding protein [Desulfitibacteraceae bacterium MK1]